MKIFKLPAQTVQLISAKRAARTASARFARSAHPPQLRMESVHCIFEAWPGLKEQVSAGGGLTDVKEISDETERNLFYRIKIETEQANRNNVTRTEAYRAVYFRCPELHWALFAHVISRNGGWNMTDLQGELLPRILSPEQIEANFGLLERANALIFSDAYPQLLLYEAGKKAGRDYSHLLPQFGVSRFMVQVWAQFWRKKESPLLTTALIVNEQHFIEARIVRSSHYKRNVLDQPEFHLQGILQTNAVIMPYSATVTGEMKLAGLVLEDFSSLEERIEFGKRLYALLYGVPEVYEGVLSFVRAVQHSGSREDYAPHLFTAERTPGDNRRRKKYKQRLTGCSLIGGARPLYSPKLAEAWADVLFESAEPGDWVDWADDVQHFFRELPLPPVFEITSEHCLGINKIELAVLAAEGIADKK
jgi:hypothetical protein